MQDWRIPATKGRLRLGYDSAIPLAGARASVTFGALVGIDWVLRGRAPAGDS